MIMLLQTEEEAVEKIPLEEGHQDKNDNKALYKMVINLNYII
jgi:hypothetical protein